MILFSSTGGNMQVCCKRNPKFKVKTGPKTKFAPRRYGDLNIVYDVLQSFGSNYLAQVTIDNDSPLGRLDRWNLTWEWMRGEIINTMRGAYTHKRDPSECLNSKAGQYYKDLDFSQVMNCQKKQDISDLPPERKEDNVTGKLPYCCKNGTLLPPIMDPWKARSMFQLQVFKLPPDLNKTALTLEDRWSSQSSVQMRATVPCNTCACGCNDIDTDTCNADCNPLLLPPDALLVPFKNRTLKAKAWAKQNHMPIPKKLPCPDNCGVSINWHVNTDYRDGWTARLTVFNWRDFAFEDWFVAVDMGKAGPGYENVYSFNGTRVPPNNRTVMFQGLPGLNYLVGQVNGTNPLRDPAVPGKQQSVISFTKKNIHGLNIPGGDGFPTKVFFNGEECALPNISQRRAQDIGVV
ncbi:unnamed protein product [Brassica rapa]|uniref:COBRA C-terminal domain-containing protein n=2 Tax=Brassica TaxID=3705 RepID=A0A8D9DGI4_BRACM|nr:unnamed protein product [Brassica napus]CAG7876905.1 unnamed protein product [Brassica rapa]